MVAASNPNLPPAFLHAANDNAQRIAGRLGDFLQATGIAQAGSDGPALAPQFPPILLLELAAVVQIQSWESAGLMAGLPHNLPSSIEAIEDIVGRLDQGFDQFAAVADACLWQIVNDVWCHLSAWEAGAILSAEIIIASMPNHDFLDAIAQFLWDSRHSRPLGSSDDDKL